MSEHRSEMTDRAPEGLQPQFVDVISGEVIHPTCLFCGVIVTGMTSITLYLHQQQCRQIKQTKDITNAS